MMMMRIIIQANLQMPIWWQQVKTGCWETNDDDEDDDDDDNESESPDVGSSK